MSSAALVTSAHYDLKMWNRKITSERRNFRKSFWMQSHTKLLCWNSNFSCALSFSSLRNEKLLYNSIHPEASRGTGTQSVTVKSAGCGSDPNSVIWNIYLNLLFHFFALVSRQSATLSSATQHVMPLEFCGK